MALKIAIQMDPMEEVNVHGDTTFDLALEAFGRQHEIWTFQPEAISFLTDRPGEADTVEAGQVRARAKKVTHLSRDQGTHVKFSDSQMLNLHEMDVVLIRQDPPFDIAYITAAQLLERLQPEVMVLNDPQGIRDAPEKLFVTDFADLTPPTLMTRDIAAIHEFRAQYKEIIIKPLYGNGGAGVFRVKPDDGNFNTIIEQFLEFYREPMIIQQFLPDVTQGDKRILLLDGDPVGAINRVPAAGETRSNMHVGGRAERVELSDRDHEICRRIGPALKERGLLLTGIDVIGTWLTEINVTSPTGVQEVRRFGGADISALYWNWVEEKRRA